jgi:hypothetical protein
VKTRGCIDEVLLAVARRSAVRGKALDEALERSFDYYGLECRPARELEGQFSAWRVACGISTSSPLRERYLLLRESGGQWAVEAHGFGPKVKDGTTLAMGLPRLLGTASAELDGSRRWPWSRAT